MQRKRFMELLSLSLIMPYTAVTTSIFDQLIFEDDADNINSMENKNNDNMPFFFLKLHPPRATFGQDMTADEKNIMQQHVAYWHQQMDQGKVVAFGPVIDPKGVYGIGIIKAADKAAVDELIQQDPANGLNEYEYYPMMAVVPSVFNSAHE